MQWTMDPMNEKWDRLLEVQEHLVQVCSEVGEDLAKNRLVRRNWNEKTTEWMRRFKRPSSQPRDSHS